MKNKGRTVVQGAFMALIAIAILLNHLYLKDLIHRNLFSIGDLNPYGGFSALKMAGTEIGYRFRGITRAMALTIAITVTALFMGRFFCGFICPIGALQDWLYAFGRKLKFSVWKIEGKKALYFEKIKYFFLLCLLVLSLVGGIQYIAAFSPYTAFLNVLSGLGFTLGVVTLALIGLFSLFVKRPFCRFLCPLGAYQGLLAAVGLTRIKREVDCGACRHCLSNCPVDIVVTEDRSLSPECVQCLNCVKAPCIRKKEGYQLFILGKKVNPKKYRVIAMVLFISLYLLLPLIQSPQESIALEAIQDGVYIGEGTGYGGIIQVRIQIEDGHVKTIEVLQQNETPVYFENAFHAFSKQMIEENRLKIDSVSGATATGRGLQNAVLDAIRQGMTDH
jgi:polyferredoxin